MSKILFVVWYIFLSLYINAQNSGKSYAESYSKYYAANQTKSDLRIINQYLNDTLGFTSFSTISISDSIVPNKEIAYWEINSISMQRPLGRTGEESLIWGQEQIKNSNEYFENVYTHWKSKFHYHNLYRSDVEARILNDTVVLTTATKSAFANGEPWCYFYWYISARKKTGELLNIDDNRKLNYFIDKIDNPYNGLFWLQYFLQGAPMSNLNSKYKAVKNGYLFMLTVRVDDHLNTMDDLLYFIDVNKHVTFIKLLKIGEPGGCI